MENEILSFGEIRHGEIIQDVFTEKTVIKVFENKVFDGRELKQFDGFVNKKCWRVLRDIEVLPTNQGDQTSLLGHISIGESFAVYEDDALEFVGIKIGQNIFMKTYYSECCGDKFDGLFEFQTNLICYKCDLLFREMS